MVTAYMWFCNHTITHLAYTFMRLSRGYECTCESLVWSPLLTLPVIIIIRIYILSLPIHIYK